MRVSAGMLESSVGSERRSLLVVMLSNPIVRGVSSGGRLPDGIRTVRLPANLCAICVRRGCIIHNNLK